MPFVHLVLCAGYASLVIELAFVAVPSVASSRQLLRVNNERRTPALTNALEVARSASTGSKILRFALPTFVVILVLALPLVQLAFPRVHAPLGRIEMLEVPGVSEAGALMVVLGRVLTIVAMRHLRSAGQAGIVRDGVFAWSRNPGLLGMFVFAAGAFAITPSVVLFFGVVFYVWHMHGRVKLEEAWLQETEPEAFGTYSRTVSRYFGRSLHA